MSVEARFYLQSITDHAGGSFEVKLAPVTRGDHNRKWSSATPGGSLSLFITNRGALPFFKDLLGANRDVRLLLEAAPWPQDPSDDHGFEPSRQEPGQSYPPEASCRHCGQGEAMHVGGESHHLVGEHDCAARDKGKPSA